MPEPEPLVVHPVCGGRTDRFVRPSRRIGYHESNALGPAPYGAGPSCVARQCQAATMFSAWGPFWPWVTSKATFWPSCSSR